MTIIRVKKKKQKMKALPFKGKVPKNIVPELGISEERRDKIRKYLIDLGKKKTTTPPPQGQIKGNPDELTYAELRDVRWSGYRHNKFTSSIELWVDGKMMGSKKVDKPEHAPYIIATLHEEVFLTVGTLAEVTEVKQ